MIPLPRPHPVAARSRPRPGVTLAAALLAGLPVALFAPAPAAAQREPSQTALRFAAARQPSAGLAQVIGKPTAGCIAGAAALPHEGPGYQVVRISRNRFYGHPVTIDFVHALGRAAREAGLPTLYVGDLSQPRGGPMTFGHASHQSGLDADIWFTLAPKPNLPAAARESFASPSLVRPDQMAVDRAQWRPAHAALLRLAATRPGVDRVLVHPAIKQELCRTAAGDRAWLRRVRPWYGHSSHFHVRMRCPDDSPDCEAFPEAPAGDGCDRSLDWWFTEAFRPRPRPRPPATPPRPREPILPIACEAVLGAESASLGR